MMQPAEFSLESVRQLMLANGGRITNHDLVKSYKRWLTDPQEKENARAQFKDYVNTLATIKQENGEKYLLLKKKFYPEYIANNCNTFDSYSSDNNFNSADIQNINPNYPPTNSSSRKASSNYHDPYQQQSLGYHQQPSSYDPPGVGSYSRQSSYSSGLGPSSLTTSSSHLAPSSVTNGHNSPSLLDEVMAGWAPPSRRQLPSVPSVPAPASAPLHGHNSLGLPSVGVPSYSRQSSVDNMPRGDTLHYNSGFNPHVSHHQSEQGGYRSSVASVASGYSSSGGNSYHGSPRHVPGYTSPPSSFTSSGSPRGSVSQRSSFSSIPHHASQSSLSQSSRAPPPYRAPPPEPVSSSSRTSESRLPPPPPPSEPVHSIQQRPLPSRPSELHLNNHHPTDPILPSSGSSSPPPPPRRTIPSDPVYSPQHPPPPLPKRQLPSTANLQPLDLGLPIQNLSSAGSRGKHSSTNNNHHHKLSQESQQPSPTDSGFTEDSSKFSDYPMPRNSSLSKSIGNLTSSNNTSSDSKVEKIEGSQSLDNLDSLPGKEDEKISVRERTKTFNRMASETELPNNPPSSSSTSSRLPPAVKRRNSRAVEPGVGGVRRFSNRHDHDDTTDSSSITTIDPTVKQWMVHTSKGDYQTAAKMLTENPKLARHRDFTNGYTGLHWAAKHGNLDMVKLLAGTYQANVNVKSHGGYTPLHIAAQHNHQEVFDLLVQAYKADANIRDYAGKKPRQHMIIGDTTGVGLSISNDTFRQLKDRRKNRASRNEKSPGMLRFGSLSVKVKKTTEAFNNYFNSKDGNTDFKNKWDDDVDKMPPPKFAPMKKRKNSKRTVDFGRTKSAPVTPERSPVKEVILEAAEENVSDSDSEYGFGDKWGPGERRVSHA